MNKLNYVVLYTHTQTHLQLELNNRLTEYGEIKY